jgi:PAS domain S-box-containing protein
MELLLGRGRRQVLGEPLDSVLPNAFMESLRGSLVFGRDEEIAHLYKLNLPTGDGRHLRVNVSVAPFVHDPGRRSGSILIVEDVTARVRLEEQLQHSEKMASIGLLAAGVAHEVNTPLAGISSYTQMALGELDGQGPVAELLNKIEKQSFRAAKIVNNLLNFSRSGGVELTSVDVNKIILDVLSLLEHQFEGSRIKVRRELADDLPLVRGDENRLQQVFFNLMLNARDAMSAGGWLTLSTRVHEGEMIAEVRDTGHGIRKEDIRRIYDPFFTTKGIGRGTGLGLSVSFGILQEHGGRLWADSTPGQGTSFRVSLPPEGVEDVAEAAAHR